MRHEAFIFPDGHLLFKDPTPEILDQIRSIYPGFKPESFPPPDDFISNLRKLKEGDLETKIKLAKEILSSCNLCGCNCGVNRLRSSGKCGLRKEAFCSEPFVHICEEAPINPAVNLKMFGCGMRCVYCQAQDHIEDWYESSEVMHLNQVVWDIVEWEKAVSLEFVGGNPTESTLGILEFLLYAPKDFDLPVVWNDNLYGFEAAYKLLDGVVDVYLPDFKYGNIECARRLSGVDRYWETATAGLKTIMKQNVRIIARVLVLPGHFECCHRRVLEWLSQYMDRIWISVLDQYVPEYKAIGHPDMGRLTTKEEVVKVERLAEKLGLRDVNKNPKSFWK